ncbi:MAG: DUF1365 domain-containing protein [Pseudomonadota bacterium]
MSKLWLYRGKVGHARLGAQTHAFAYDSLFLCFPLQQRQALASKLFGYNRWNLFGYHDADHGDGADPEAWMRNILSVHGVTSADGDIWLQALPRILGFVFNPVSFWYCHDRQQQLRAVLCEVRNTFGERHCYLLTAVDQGVITMDTTLHSEKVFHVSPFYPVNGQYQFQFAQRGDFRRVQIDYWQDGELSLKTHVSGTALAMTDKNLLKTFVQLGWATLMVVLRIHWQALKLWRQGVTFHRKPVPPVMEISR